MKFIKAILVVLFPVFLALPSVVCGAVFNVSSVTGFQNALNTSTNNGENDTINVAAGIYNVTSPLIYAPSFESDNFSLTIQGIGAGSTILDGGDTNQIMNIDTTGLSNDSSVQITIRGMTFQNGRNSPGLFRRLIRRIRGKIFYIEKNSSGLLRQFTRRMRNITFPNEKDISGSGGGLFVLTSSADITVKDSEFSGNDADWDGGGVYASSTSGTVTLTNNAFSDNETDGSGSGVDVVSTSGAAILTNNTFSGNDAYSEGGAVCAASDSGTVTLANNSFSGNSSINSNGGGANVESTSGTIILTNNTFSGNNAGGNGGGVFVHLHSNNATGNIYNNIIWGNTATFGGDDLYVHDGRDGDNTGATVNLYNNDYRDFFSACLHFAICTPNINQVNNINADPLLTSLFHLQASSPSINAGNNNAPSLPSTDFKGGQRIINNTVDIGADEYAGD